MSSRKASPSPAWARAALLLARRVVPESRLQGARRRYDPLGAITVTGSLVMVVYAISQAPAVGWTAAQTLALLASSAALLAAFVVIEARAEAPLLPLRLFRLRTLAGSNVVGFMLGHVVASGPVDGQRPVAARAGVLPGWLAGAVPAARRRRSGGAGRAAGRGDHDVVLPARHDEMSRPGRAVTLPACAHGAEEPLFAGVSGTRQRPPSQRCLNKPGGIAT